MVNLYKFYFQLNKKVLHPPLFHPSNQIEMRETKNFSIFPLFHPLYFLFFHFFILPTKQTLSGKRESIYITVSLLKGSHLVPNVGPFQTLFSKRKAK